MNTYYMLVKVTDDENPVELDADVIRQMVEQDVRLESGVSIKVLQLVRHMS